MVNKTMEAKRIKYIRQSKARPRALRMNHGYQRAGQSVDKSKIPKEYMGLFAYRDRGKTFVDEFLEAKFPSHATVREPQVMEEKERTIRTIFVDRKYQKTVMFADTRMTCFYFIEFLPLVGIVRYSVTYASHKRALQVFHQQTIRWKETLQIPNVE